jgi:hypothetical protein
VITLARPIGNVPDLHHKSTEIKPQKLRTYRSDKKLKIEKSNYKNQDKKNMNKREFLIIA